MSQVNYDAMSDRELRQHFLKHREDKTALRAYLDRLSHRPHNVITTVDDPILTWALRFKQPFCNKCKQQMITVRRRSNDSRSCTGWCSRNFVRFAVVKNAAVSCRFSTRIANFRTVAFILI